MASLKGVTVTNRILASLPRKDYRQIAPKLEPVALVFGDILYDAGDPIRHVYFPIDSVVSLITIIEQGKAAEVGLVGLPIALGAKVSPLRAVVQGAGTAMRMSAPSFRKFAGNQALQRALFGFTHLLMGQVAQTAACNRFHVVSARLARWLLMTRDRVVSNQFKLTHEFLGHMLGVQRVAVTQAATALQKKGLISYSRGNITILDRRALEGAACSCYSHVKKMYARA